jgi:hypothetical protein
MIKRGLGVEFLTTFRICPVILAGRCDSCGHREYWKAYREKLRDISQYSKCHYRGLLIFGNTSRSVITIQYS